MFLCWWVGLLSVPPGRVPPAKLRQVVSPRRRHHLFDLYAALSRATNSDIIDKLLGAKAGL